MSKPHSVTVSILDKEYQVASPPEEKHALIEAAQYLDKNMRDIRNGGRVVGGERIAVMAALNIAYELLQAQTANVGGKALEADIKRLNGKLEEALMQARQLEIS